MPQHRAAGVVALPLLADGDGAGGDELGDLRPDGFVAGEERDDVWPGNPCLLMTWDLAGR